MMNKICNSCKLLLDVSLFSSYKKAKDGLQLKCKNCVKQYNLLNKIKMSERHKQWYLNNKNKVAEYNKEYKNLHKEDISKWQKQYRLANPELVHNRKVKRKNLIAGNKISKGIIKKLYNLQKGLCVCCRKLLSSDYNVDHIMPLSRGGTHTDENIQLLCSLCNRQKHAKHPIEFMQSRGYLL